MAGEEVFCRRHCSQIDVSPLGTQIGCVQETELQQRNRSFCKYDKFLHYAFAWGFFFGGGGT